MIITWRQLLTVIRKKRMGVNLKKCLNLIRRKFKELEKGNKRRGNERDLRKRLRKQQKLPERKSMDIPKAKKMKEISNEENDKVVQKKKKKKNKVSSEVDISLSKENGEMSSKTKKKIEAQD